MAALPFRLNGSAQHAAVLEALSQPINSWSSHWFSTKPTIVPKIRNEDTVDWKVEPWFVVGSAPDLWMAWKLDSAACKELVAAMVQGTLGVSAKTTPLVTSLMQDAVKDLFLRVSHLHPEMQLVHEPLDTALGLRSGYGSGTLQLELSGDFVRQHLVLGGGVVELLASRESAINRSRLIARDQLLGGYSTQLEVQVGKAEITLQELADMEVGDVIQLQTHINQPFEVLSPNSSQPIARVHLGLIGNHKAIQFID